MRVFATTTTLLVLGFAVPGVLADEAKKLPSSGIVKFQVSYIQTAERDVNLTDKVMFGTTEFYGVTRVIDGDRAFDRMTEHCTGQHYGFDTKSGMMNGSCLYTDADGDKMMVNWVDDAPSG